MINEVGETVMEKFIRKSSKEPLVPLGCACTVAFLVRGLKAFNSGEKQTSQMMMRGRIGAQAFTIAVIMIGAYSGFNPRDRQISMEEKISNSFIDQHKK